MKHWKLVLAGIAFFAAFVIFIRSKMPMDAVPVTPSQKAVIAVSFYPIEFVVGEIVDDAYELFPVVASGVEPHDFEPSPQDLVRLQQAKVLVYNGLGLEPWVERMAPSLREQGVQLIDASASFDTVGYDLMGGDEIDPHVWLDPKALRIMANTISTGLMDAFPTDAKRFETNNHRLQGQLVDLDTRFAQGLASCTLNNIIVSHDAFGYLARQYGFGIIPIAGFSPQEQPSAKRLGELATLAKEQGITTIFTETLVSPKLAETLAKEVGATTAVLDPLEGISPAERKAGANYMTVMDQNLAALQSALQCS